jgi:hypothetical protein
MWIVASVMVALWASTIVEAGPADWRFGHTRPEHFRRREMLVQTPVRRRCRALYRETNMKDQRCRGALCV